jgi:4-carboxymuconolactone decarboxylase
MSQAGDEYYEQLRAKFAPAADYLMECCFGTVWSRPALGDKVRELCTLSALTAMGKLPQIKGHVKGALRAGNSKEEVLEVLLHMFPYCGWPATLNAIGVAFEAFEEMEAELG